MVNRFIHTCGQPTAPTGARNLTFSRCCRGEVRISRGSYGNRKTTGAILVRV